MQILEMAESMRARDRAFSYWETDDSEKLKPGVICSSFPHLTRHPDRIFLRGDSGFLDNSSASLTFSCEDELDAYMYRITTLLRKAAADAVARGHDIRDNNKDWALRPENAAPLRAIRSADLSNGNALYLLGWLYAGLQLDGSKQAIRRNDWLAFVYFCAVRARATNAESLRQVDLALAHVSQRLTPEAIEAAHAVTRSLQPKQASFAGTTILSPPPTRTTVVDILTALKGDDSYGAHHGR